MRRPIGQLTTVTLPYWYRDPSTTSAASAAARNSGRCPGSCEKSASISNTNA
jgi:hypothetical protein